MLAGPIISSEQAIALDQAHQAEKHELYAQGLGAHTAQEPAFRLSGPLVSVILTDSNKHSSHHILGYGRRHYS